MSLARTWKRYQEGSSVVLPVYVNERTVLEVTRMLADCMPNEGIVKLFGFDCEHEGLHYARVTDYFTGEQDVTPVTATFTDAGLREVELARQDRYPDRESRPIELGTAHSHPFGYEPSFSGVDRETFTTFPYGADNVHLLLDPSVGYVKAYIGVECSERRRLELVEVHWGLYRPHAKLLL